MNIQKFKEFFKHNLIENLPGYDSQIKMAPKFDKSIARSFIPTKDARKSAVLVLLSLSNNNKIQVLLTLRSENLSSHGGQISFPGGRAENNETSVETALREANEETAFIPGNAEVLGNLTELFVPPSNSLITPVVAFTENLGNVKANYDEVSEIILLEIEKIAGKDKIKYFENSFGNRNIKYPYWDIHPTTKLWGATAIILNELLEIYEKYKD